MHPLGAGTTFKITSDLPHLSGWSRIPAALPAHIFDDPDYPYAAAAAAAAPNGAQRAAGGVAAGAAASSTPAAGSTAKPAGAVAADPSYGGSGLQSAYRGERDTGDDEGSEDEGDSTEAEEGSNEGEVGGEGPTYGGGDGPYVGDVPYEQQQPAPGWYEGPYYSTEGSHGRLQAVRGKADTYR